MTKINVSGLRKKPAANDNPMTISQAYMRNIIDYSLLSQEEEIQLAEEIRSPDPRIHEEAKSKLIQANLRLVVKLASEFLNRGVAKHDLIAEGNIGLMIAAEKFDPSKGAKFSTYSTWWIKQYMRRAIAAQSRTIRIPAQSIDKIVRIQRAQREFMQINDREPTDDEIAEMIDLNPKTVSELRRVNLTTSSLNELIKEGETDEIGSLVADAQASVPDSILGHAESMESLHQMIGRLAPRERDILNMRYGLEGGKVLTLEEVGEAVGCTRERVRQIQNKAIRKLQRMHEELNGDSIEEKK
jgi:RNA polymerase primary sigma factor